MTDVKQKITEFYFIRVDTKERFLGLVFIKKINSQFISLTKLKS